MELTLLKQQIELTDAIGKTLEGAYFSTDGELLLTFSGDTFTILTVGRGYEPGDEEIKQGSYNYADFRDDLLVEAGIVAQAELDLAHEESTRRARERSEQYDREAYERLKAKFEPTEDKEP